MFKWFKKLFKKPPVMVTFSTWYVGNRVIRCEGRLADGTLVITKDEFTCVPEAIASRMPVIQFSQLCDLE